MWRFCFSLLRVRKEGENREEKEKEIEIEKEKEEKENDHTGAVLHMRQGKIISCEYFSFLMKTLQVVGNKWEPYLKLLQEDYKEGYLKPM